VVKRVRNSHSINKEYEKSVIKAPEINITKLIINNITEEVVDDFKNMI
jgi:hypothetical protein